MPRRGMFDFLRPPHAARFPAGVIQTPNVAQRLRSAYDIKGKSLSPQLGDQLHPVVIVDDLSQPQWFDVTEIRRSYSFIQIAPVAAQNGYFTIANPVGSGVVIYLESFYAVAATSTVLVGRVTGAEPATVEVGQYFDDRVGVFSTACRLRSGTNAVLQIASPWIRQNPGSSDGYVKIGAVLQPGGLPWGIQHATVNIQSDFGFTWLERPLNV